MSSVNLLDWPWIPCSDMNGQPVELGIRETLRRAPQLRALRDPSPMVTVALHRTLLAVLHRALDGPQSAEQWADWWHAGDWDQPAIAAYLDRWTARFFLDDDVAPFFQNPAIVFGPEGTIKEDSVKPLAYMIPGMTFGNNTTLFDHSVDERPLALSPGEAARHLVTVQAVALGGFVSTLVHEERRGKQNLGTSFAAPLARGAITLVRGENLFQTLMLNLHQYHHAIGQPFDNAGRQDRPAWERDPNELTNWIRDRPQEELARVPDGYADLLTWQSRRVRLQLETEADGTLVVRRAAILRGWSYAASWHPVNGETMMAFTRNDKAKDGQDPFPPLLLREDRSLWRDSVALLQTLEGTSRKPVAMLEWVAEVRFIADVSPDTVFAVDVFGAETDRKTISFWRHEELPLPAECINDDIAITVLGEALGLAEEMGRLLTGEYVRLKSKEQKMRNMPTPARIFAEAMLPGPLDKDKRKQVDPAAIRGQIETLAMGKSYWPSLSVRFWELVNEVVSTAGDVRRPELCRIASERWAVFVQLQARRALRDTLRSFDYASSVMQASAKAEYAMDWQSRSLADRFVGSAMMSGEEVEGMGNA